MATQAASQDLTKYDVYIRDPEKLIEAEFIKWAYQDLSNIEGTNIGIKDISNEIEKLFKSKCSQRPYYLLIERTLYLATAFTAALLFTAVIIKFNFSVAKLLPKNRYLNSLSLSECSIVTGLVSALFFAIRQPQLESVEAEVVLECKKPDWKYHKQAIVVKSWIASINDSRLQINELRERCDLFHTRKELRARSSQALSKLDNDKLNNKEVDLLAIKIIKTELLPELIKIKSTEDIINGAVVKANNQLKLVNRLSDLDKKIVWD